MTRVEIVLRRFGDSDSIDELTDLLHRAYAKLARAGLRFNATHQDSTVTRRRIAGAECYVLVHGERLVGTVAFHPPGTKESRAAWYNRPDVAKISQFGVDPAYQGQGLGRRLFQQVIARAKDTGASELALDTAEPATQLIKVYRRYGFRPVDRIEWGSTNYSSVIMSLSLEPVTSAPPSGTFPP